MSRKYNEELAAFDNSEVMREFMKVAYDSGVVEREDKVDVDGGEEGRRSSETIKELEDKYDVGVTEDKTGRDLIEMAHPEKAEILNSYLKGADVVENGNEQQDIMIDVALKGPTINDIYHREVTAITNLMDELVVIADEMDLREQNDLACFADSILNGMVATGEIIASQKKKLIVEAAGERAISTGTSKLLTWLGIGAGVLLVGAYGLSKKQSGITQEVPQAAETAIRTLSVFIGSDQPGADANDLRTLETVKASIENNLGGIEADIDSYNLRFAYVQRMLQLPYKKVSEAVFDKFVKDYNDSASHLTKKLTTVLAAIEAKKQIAERSTKSNFKEDADIGGFANLVNNTKQIGEFFGLLNGPGQQVVYAIAHLAKSIRNKLEDIKGNQEYVTSGIQEYRQKPTQEQSNQANSKQQEAEKQDEARGKELEGYINDVNSEVKTPGTINA